MRVIIPLTLAIVAGCTSPSLQPNQPTVDDIPDAQPAVIETTAPPPPEGARTAEQFDTTSEEERAAAVAVTPASAEAEPEQALGTTIASLGSPTDPGIWLKTPLVSAVTAGRIEYEGKSINIELRPSGGAAGSGSQISLAAMRLIDAPLTGLPELTVFSN